MPTVKPFVVTVADILHRPAARRHEHIVATTAEMVVTETVVAEGAPLEVEAKLESVGSGILATGSAGTHWRSTCRRCLQPVEGDVRADFQEEFVPHAVDGETYPLVHDTVDLEVVAREAILLDLPLAPLCREDCAGLCPTCGADLNDGSCACASLARDPRWAALDVLVKDPERLEDPGQRLNEE